MRGEDPESIIIIVSSEGVQTHSLRDVPKTNTSIFRVGDDQLAFGVKQDARYVARVASHGINFPCFGFIHSPQLDEAIVGTRHDQGKYIYKRRMESRPIDNSLVTLKNVLDKGVITSEKLVVDTGNYCAVVDLRRWASDVLLTVSSWCLY